MRPHKIKKEQEEQIINLLWERKFTQKEIAEQFNVSPKTIERFKASEKYTKGEIKLETERLKRLKAKAIEIADEAIDTLKAKLKSQDEEVARKAANDILEIVGLKKPKGEIELPSDINVNVIHKTITGKEDGN